MVWVGIIAIVLVLGYFYITAPGQAHLGNLTSYKYAHRGLHGHDIAENSLRAFEAACEAGYGIELDVYLSRDGKVIVFHDADLKRMTGHAGHPGDYTAAELCAMQLGNTTDTIPLFEEVLELVDGRVPILVETKSTGAASSLEPAVWDLLQKYEGPYLIQSFSPLSIGWFRKHAPGVLRGQLSCRFSGGTQGVPAWEMWCVKHLCTNVLCRPDFINFGLMDDGLRSPVVRRLRHQVPIFAWTVRSEEQARLCAPWCDTIVFELFRPDPVRN